MTDHRKDLLEVMRGEGSMLDGGAIVVGFALVVELIDADGERGVSKITSDAAGRPAPWYMSDAYAAALTDLAEFDEGDS